MSSTGDAPVRVAVLDPRPLVHEALLRWLADEPGVEIVGTTTARGDLPSRPVPVDVVLLGPAETSVPERFERAQLVRFTDSSSPTELLDALGRDPVAAQGRRPRRHQAQPPRLTARERQVLAGVAEGRPIAEVAADLGISRKSVENHKQRIFGKLGVRNQAHAVSLAARSGQLSPACTGRRGERGR